MASNYVTVGSRQTVQVLSQTQVVPVQQVNAYTQPHGSYIQIEVPLLAWQEGKEAQYIEPVATLIETIWKDGFITKTQFVQDVDGAGLLTSYVDFTVSYQASSGLALPYSTVVRVPIAALSSETAFTSGTMATDYGLQIAAAYNQLAATASA